MSACPQSAGKEVSVFVTSRNQNWSVGKAYLMSTETIEEMEEWLKGYSSVYADGVEFFTYMVEITPQLKYTVIHETRGEIWDGDSE